MVSLKNIALNDWKLRVSKIFCYKREFEEQERMDRRCSQQYLQIKA